MSNAVRSLGSGRGVDAAPRHGGGTHADLGAPDTEFAAVMNLAMGATDGATASNGGAADSDSGLLGQGNPGQGQAQAGAAPSADATESAEAIAAPNATPQSQVPTIDTAPVRIEPKVLPSATALLAGAGKSVPAAPPASLPPTALPTDKIAAPVAPVASIKQRRPTDADPSTLEPTTPDAAPAIGLPDTAVAATATATPTPLMPATVPMSAPDLDRDVGKSEITGPVSAVLPHRHRHSADGASPPRDDPVTLSVGPALAAVIVDTQAVDPMATPNAAPSIVAPRPATRTTDKVPSPIAADRSGWRLPVDGNAPPPARATVQSDFAPPSPSGVISNDSRPAIEQPEMPVDRFAAQPVVGTQQQSGDVTTVDFTTDPSASVPAGPRHDAVAATPAPAPAVVPAQIAMAIVNVVASSVTGGLRQSAPTSVTTIDGMVSAPAPNSPAIVAVTASADSGASGGASSSFSDALANHVMNLISTGHQEATLQLQPPQLGELTVRVSIQGRDVSTWFGAAQPQVQLAVTQALDQLRTDLAGAGLNLAGAWVGADASGLQQRAYETGAAPSRRAGFTVPSADRAAADTPDGPRRTSGVSVYV